MDGQDDDVKRGPGRPKGQKLSPAELAQRRAAPVTHGQYARTVTGATLPACKPSSCPATYPCEIKEAVEREGGGVHACPVPLVDAGLVDAYRLAIEQGDTSKIAELAASHLGGLAGVARSELARLQGEELVIEHPI